MNKKNEITRRFHPENELSISRAFPSYELSHMISFMDGKTPADTGVSHPFPVCTLTFLSRRSNMEETAECLETGRNDNEAIEMQITTLYKRGEMN